MGETEGSTAPSVSFPGRLVSYRKRYKAPALDRGVAQGTAMDWQNLIKVDPNVCRGPEPTGGWTTV